MPAIDVTQAETLLTNAIAAYTKALNSKRYSHEGAQVRTDVEKQKIEDMLDQVIYWNEQVIELGGEGQGILIQDPRMEPS